MNLNCKKQKSKWFKKYKKEVLDKEHKYYSNSLSEIFNFDANIKLFCVCIYDVVDNNEINKIIKKLYSLKGNDQYDIEINFRKKTIKNINYIRPEFDHTGHGIFASIKFISDNIISNVDMTWSQINNDQAIIEYEIRFNECIDKFKRIHNFIIENYELLNKIKYSPFYYDIDFFKNEDSQNIQTELKYFRTLLQYKIDIVLSSSYSNKYLLPIKYTYLIDSQTKKIMEYIKAPFLEESFIIDKEQYLIINSLEEFEGAEISELIFKKTFNPISIITLMSRYKMNLYYKFFYNIEKKELEYKICKYLNSKKICVNIWNYKWLLNKKRRLDEKRFYSINHDSYQNIKGFSDEKVGLIDENIIKNIGDVYNEYIEYIKNLNSINYNIIAFTISVLALVISIIAIFIK